MAGATTIGCSAAGRSAPSCPDPGVESCRGGGAMRRYLVVANQTLGGEHLAEKVRACLAAGPSRFHVLVPATQPQDHAVWTEGEARAIASRRLEQALERFRELGDRERRTLEARYGLGGQQPRTLREVGEEFGLTAQRVAQIEQRALQKLRDAMEEENPSAS